MPARLARTGSEGPSARCLPPQRCSAPILSSAACRDKTSLNCDWPPVSLGEELVGFGGIAEACRGMLPSGIPRPAIDQSEDTTRSDMDRVVTTPEVSVSCWIVATVDLPGRCCDTFLCASGPPQH